MNSKSLQGCLLVMWCGLAAISPCLDAASTQVIQLLPKPPTGGPAPSEFGSAVVLSDRWLVVGEAGNNEQAMDAGAIHVFDARSGKFVRKLLALDPPASRRLGNSLAIRGNLLLAGAPADNEFGVDAGAIYVFNLVTGQQIAKWTADDAAADSWFGFGLAISGNLALIGAPFDDEFGAQAGAAYVFDIDSGSQLHKLTASAPIAGEFFGYSVAMQNGLAIIGATGSTGAVAGSGAAYFFDAVTDEEIEKVFATAGAAADGFGASVALEGDVALVGAPNHDNVFPNEGAIFGYSLVNGNEIAVIRNPVYAGASHRFGWSITTSNGMLFSAFPDPGNVYQVDLRTAQVIQEIVPPQVQNTDFYGNALAVHGNQLAVAAVGDDTIATDAGAVYLLRPLSGTLPLDIQAHQKDAAPGVANAKFANFSLPSIARSGSLLFTANLIGAGAAGGKNSGIWNSQNPGGSQVLLLQKKEALDSYGPDFIGTRLAQATAISCNHPNFGLFRATLSGASVNAGNNQALFRNDGDAVDAIVRTGVDLPLLGGARIRNIGDSVQNRIGLGDEQVAFRHQLQRVSGSVTAANDTGLLFADLATATLIDADALEGEAAPGGGDFGQFTNRAAFVENTATFQSRRILPGSALPAVFMRAAGFLTFSIADSGMNAPGLPGLTLKNFLGEGATPGNAALYRASLSGADVTAKNNEGIWHATEGLIARKGDPVPGEAAGVTWKRFLGFWPVANTGVAIHAVIAGPGVAPGSTGVWVFQEDASFRKLLKTGDWVDGSEGARVRNIQRVDFESMIGRYTILANVSGSPARNQILFGGLLGIGDPQFTPSVRSPKVRLRKGLQLQGALGSIRTIKGMSLAKTTDQTGSGAKGRGQAVNGSGFIGLQTAFDQAQRALTSLETIDLQP